MRERPRPTEGGVAGSAEFRMRKSEAVALTHPVVPVGDGFVGGFVPFDGLQLR